MKRFIYISGSKIGKFIREIAFSSADVGVKKYNKNGLFEVGPRRHVL